MPVNKLLCEGANNSPDVRLLGVILKGSVGVVAPSGGKGGFPNLVRGLRRDEPHVCGIVDGDFPRKPDEWAPSGDPGPRPWWYNHDGVKMMLGWMWQRKEIENYFIDPDVLARAFGWDPVRKAAYEAALGRIFDSLGHVTAARIALTVHAPRKTRLETNVPLVDTEDKLKQELRKIAAEYNEGARVKEDALIEDFDRYIPECRGDGRFRARALEVFAGKDIFARIATTSGFDRELKDLDKVVERVINALEQDEAPHTWLPEWSALRSAVQIWTPAGSWS